jgi:membrane-bound ClpP family serine protease
VVGGSRWKYQKVTLNDMQQASTQAAAKEKRNAQVAVEI